MAARHLLDTNSILCRCPCASRPSHAFIFLSALRECVPASLVRMSRVHGCRPQPVQAPAAGAAKRSKVEIYKEESDYLRYPLIDDLKNDLPNVSAASEQVRQRRLRAGASALPRIRRASRSSAPCLPFLVRIRALSVLPTALPPDDREARQGGGGRAYQFMMRTRQPGGKVHNRLYLAMDDLADQFGSGTLRLTTRQTFQVRSASLRARPSRGIQARTLRAAANMPPAISAQHLPTPISPPPSPHPHPPCVRAQLHGVLKANLKEVFATVIKSMGSTLGACGDLNRNVLAPEVPFVDRPAYRYCQEYADKIAALLEPQSGAYYDVWLDGEKVRGGGMEGRAHGRLLLSLVSTCLPVASCTSHFPVPHPLPSAVWLALSNNLPPRHGSHPPSPRQVLTAEAPADVEEARADNRFGTNIEGSAEPIYGTQYLPRKFKVAITVPGDNSVDLLTNDLGLVVLCDDATGQLQGFNIYVSTVLRAPQGFGFGFRDFGVGFRREEGAWSWWDQAAVWECFNTTSSSNPAPFAVPLPAFSLPPLRPPARPWQVGGGMGRSHRNEQTEPRLAEPLGYVAAEDVLYAVKAIVATQRDYGRRDDRKQVGGGWGRRGFMGKRWGGEGGRRGVRGQGCGMLQAWMEEGNGRGALIILAVVAFTTRIPSLFRPSTLCHVLLPASPPIRRTLPLPSPLRAQARLKYLIRDWGIDRFRTVTEQYFGKQFQPFRPLPEWQSKPYVGWGEQVSRAALSEQSTCCAVLCCAVLCCAGDGRLYYGLHIENGRIKGEAKKALRAVIEKYNLPVRISANQNLMLCDVRKAWRPRITQELAAVGILGKQYVDPLNLTAMACPALPLCGLAITEAERGLPSVLKRIRAMLDKVGLRQQQAHSLVVRMTGCPNGCARPYVAELGFVGDGANSYQLWLGGTPNQTVLARVFLERVKVGELEAVLEPLFAMWKAHGHKAESFGDFTNRVGFEAMKEYMGTYTAPIGRQRGMARRITVDDELAGKLQEVAMQRGTTVAKVTREALLQFLAEHKDE
ncbi:unnamed protein product [Closterium sp. NIES-53]